MDKAVTAGSLVRSLSGTPVIETPYRHWRPRSLLDGGAAVVLAELPLELPTDLDLSAGRRETNNKSRMFFDAAGQAREPAIRAVAEAMQAPEVVAAWEKLCDIDLTGTFLRIEYCRD